MDKEDYQNFYQCLDMALSVYSIELHAYSLTSNKLLLLLSAPDKERLCRFMQYIAKGYTHYFNHRHQRHGTLWNSRYNCCPVEPGAYFLLTQKYVEYHCADDSPHHSFGGIPDTRIIPHEEYLRLGENTAQRLISYRRFCLRIITPSVITQIKSALAQNSLLATSSYSRVLEEKYQRHLRPRKIGRPRKHYQNAIEKWEWLEKKAEYLLHQYCYNEIRMPLLEELGENTAQSFSSESNELILSNETLFRGDGTMGCLQLLSQYQKLQNGTRLWYQGTMFRSVNQKNIHQFHQLGVEAFGYPSIGIEIELVLLQFEFFKSLHLHPFVELKINTLGNSEEFEQFRRHLRQYYQPMIPLLNPRQIACIEKRPELLLTDNDNLMQYLAKKAPQIDTYISTKSHQRFDQVCDALTTLNIPFTHDRNLFPVNDYNGLVFEWYANSLNQNNQNKLLCRGGRYDSSASRIIGHPVSACGFAFMLEPIMQLLTSTRKSSDYGKHIDVVIIPSRERAQNDAFLLGRSLRRNFPHLSILNDYSTQRLSLRQKNARHLGGRFILLIDGSDEVTFCDEENHCWMQIPLHEVTAHLSKALVML